MIRWNNLAAAALLTLPLALFSAYCGASTWQVAAIVCWVFVCMHIGAILANRDES
jgi:hypothetical protein